MTKFKRKRNVGRGRGEKGEKREKELEIMNIEN